MDHIILTLLFMGLGIVLGIVAIALAFSPVGWIMLV